MGIYLSISAIIGGIIVAITHNRNIITKSAIAIWGIIANTLSAVFFAFNFNFLGIYFNQLVNNISNGIVNPVEFDLNVRCSNKIEPDDRFSLEIIVIQELIYTLARFIICILILVLSNLINDIELFLKIILIITVMSKILIYKLSIDFINDSNK